jgi:O-acetyl-ADP-ribose deacetylase (regulator of RNase III)
VGKKPKKLRDCYRNALELALKHNVRSVAFSSISTGVFGYPLHSATRVALDT